MPILSWAPDTSLDEYKRALWLALMSTHHPIDRAILLRELERLNEEEALSWRTDETKCQSSAQPGADKQCSQDPQWCLQLGQLKHFHVCSEHGMEMLRHADPIFLVQRIEECSEWKGR